MVAGIIVLVLLIAFVGGIFAFDRRGRRRAGRGGDGLWFATGHVGEASGGGDCSSGGGGDGGGGGGGDGGGC